MSLQDAADALRYAIRELRLAYGYRDRYQNGVIDVMAEALAEVSAEIEHERQARDVA